MYNYMYTHIYIYAYIICTGRRIKRNLCALAITGAFSLAKPAMVQVSRLMLD